MMEWLENYGHLYIFDMRKLARRFFVMMTAAFGGKDSARVVDMLSQREGIL